MTPEFDTSDPLGLLMAEWSQIATWFWVFLAAAAVTCAVLPDFALPVVGAALGVPLIKLGHTVVIVGNELRKSVGRAPQEDD